MVKIQEIQGRYFVSIPKEYIQQAKMAKGDTLTVSYNERENIELSKVNK